MPGSGANTNVPTTARTRGGFSLETGVISMSETILHAGSLAVARNYEEATNKGYSDSKKQFWVDLIQHDLSGSVAIGCHSIPRDDLQAIQNVRRIEDQFISANIRLAVGVIKKIRSPMAYEELLSEASIALWEAMYRYTDNTIQFSTFATTVIRNRLYDLARRHAHALYHRYATFMERMEKERQQSVSFDEVVREMELKPYVVKNLRNSLVKVTAASSLGMTLSEVTLPDSKKAAVEQLQAIAQAKEELSESDQVVLDAWLTDGERGWQQRLATQRGVSRAAIGQIKQRIIRVIGSKCSQAA